MRQNPLRILTPYQADVLRALAQEPLLRDFYLTGGTALSAFYLQHRLSDDLDFFTEVPQAVTRIPPLIRRLAKKTGARIAFGRRFETLFECTLLHEQKGRLEMDFALDMPGRLKPITRDGHFGISLDNLADIACNKLSALYERAEAKDFADVYFIHREYLPLKKLIRQARKKYPELDDYGFAMAFFKVKGIAQMPIMKKALSKTEMTKFFLDHAKRMF